MDKLVSIIEEELNQLGALKVDAPLLHPKSLWLESGRWEKMNKELFSFEDRYHRQYCLQPTAEEMITKIFVGFGMLLNRSVCFYMSSSS